jgi:SPP1 gp7 family putative phage head morphogenesis protein
MARRDPRRHDRYRVKSGRAERDYYRSLRDVAAHIGTMVGAFPPLDDSLLGELLGMLRAYSKALRPWARRTAHRMLEEVNRRDIDTWEQLSKDMSTQLQHDIRRTPVGSTIARLMAEQTELITSLPTKAAERIQLLTLEARTTTGARSMEIARAVLATGEVTKARAQLIARTEVAKAASNLTMARAAQAGSTHYIWRTVEDASVRPGHHAMDGKICDWASPPAVNENGRIMYHHPGCIWNCRCWAQSILPD